MLLKRGDKSPERLVFINIQHVIKLVFTSYENMLKQVFIIARIIFSPISDKWSIYEFLKTVKYLKSLIQKMNIQFHCNSAEVTKHKTFCFYLGKIAHKQYKKTLNFCKYFSLMSIGKSAIQFWRKPILMKILYLKIYLLIRNKFYNVKMK